MIEEIATETESPIGLHSITLIDVAVYVVKICLYGREGRGGKGKWSLARSMGEARQSSDALYSTANSHRLHYGALRYSKECQSRLVHGSECFVLNPVIGEFLNNFVVSYTPTPYNHPFLPREEPPYHTTCNIPSHIP